MATHKPDAVAIRASPTPPVMADAPAPESRILKEILNFHLKKKLIKVKN